MLLKTLPKRQLVIPKIRNMTTARLPRDIQDFLSGYPAQDDNDPKLTANVDFYSNRIKCRPDNMTIDQLHADWWEDYDNLEYNHGFIQWLFPIRESGKSHPFILVRIFY